MVRCMTCESCGLKPGTFRPVNGWTPDQPSHLCDHCHEYNDGEFTIGGVTWICEYCYQGVNNCHCQLDWIEEELYESEAD